MTFLAEEQIECCGEIILSCNLECKNPLRFHLIIDKKHFGGEKDGELKSCDAGFVGGESSKLS